MNKNIIICIILFLALSGVSADETEADGNKKNADPAVKDFPARQTKTIGGTAFSFLPGDEKLVQVLGEHGIPWILQKIEKVRKNQISKGIGNLKDNREDYTEYLADRLQLGKSTEAIQKIFMRLY